MVCRTIAAGLVHHTGCRMAQGSGRDMGGARDQPPAEVYLTADTEFSTGGAFAIPSAPDRSPQKRPTASAAERDRLNRRVRLLESLRRHGEDFAAPAFAGSGDAWLTGGACLTGGAQSRWSAALAVPASDGEDRRKCSQYNFLAVLSR